MISDQDVITLTVSVAVFTLITVLAYLYLVTQFKKSIQSNDDLKSELLSMKNELCGARSEISQLRSDLAQSGQEKTTLKKALDDCLGRQKED